MGRNSRLGLFGVNPRAMLSVVAKLTWGDLAKCVCYPQHCCLPILSSNSAGLDIFWFSCFCMFSCKLELGGGSPVDKTSLFQTKIQSEEEVVAAEDVMDDEEEDGALEALFKQLEEDLENDDLSVDDDEDEISEEDMARFEKELAEAIEEVGGVAESAGDSLLCSADHGSDEKLDGGERPELKTWQLRRLARALKIGRRKTSVSCCIFT